MPRASDSGGARLRIPGVYEKLLAGWCGHRIGDGQGWCGFDPRGNPAFRSCPGPSEHDVAVWDWLQAECRWKSEMDRRARIAVGEPFLTDRRRFGGHSIPRQDGWPAWLRDPYSDVEKVRVFADDTIVPVSDAE